MTTFEEHKKKFGSSQKIIFTCQDEKCGTELIQEFDDEKQEYSNNLFINNTKNKENEIWKLYRFQRLTPEQRKAIGEGERSIGIELNNKLANKCDSCGKQKGLASGFGVIKGKTYCRNCANRITSNIIITTTMNVEGYVITKYIDVESVGIVIGTGLFSELTSSLDDFFGIRSTEFENKLQNSKKQAFDMLKIITIEKEGNAVIGIDLDYTEFTSNRIGFIVNGTIVRIEPIP
jgi:uncharacterized protein YbjQ (UPF0145 family)